MPKIRNIIIFIAIAGALLLIYVLFVKQSSPQASLVSSPSTTSLPNTSGLSDSAAGANINGTSSVAKDFLALLLNIQNIKLDDSILSDPAFTNLHDSSITLIPDATTGRPNPFAQFGAENIVAPATVPSVIPPTAPAPIKP